MGAVTNESAPDPSVFKNSPALPSAWGSLKVILLGGLLVGVVSETLLPPECTNFM